MRCLAKTAIALLVLFSGLLFPPDSTVFAQETTQSTTNTAPAAGNNTTESLISQIISAAEQDGVRIIVIDGTTQQDNSTAQDSSGNNQSSATDLDNLALTTTSAGGLSFTKIQTGVLEFREILKSRIAELPSSIAKTHNELRKKSPTGDLHPYFHALYWSILLLAFGAWLEHQIYIKYIVARWLKADLKSNPQGYLDKFPFLIKRAILKIIGVVLSMVIAFFVGGLLFRGTPPESIQFTIATLYLGYAACRLVAIIWRLILAPYLVQYRISNFSNRDARKLYHWLWIISSINILLIMIGIWVAELGGKSSLHASMESLFGACTAVLNILMVIINRKALSRAIRNGKTLIEAGAIQRFLSKSWLFAAVGYFIFSWLELTYRGVIGKPALTPLIAGAYGILLSTLCVYALINYFIERCFEREKHFVTLGPDELLITNTDVHQSSRESLALSETVTENTVLTSDASPTEDVIAADLTPVRHPLTTYQDLARRVAAILAIISGLWALTKIWNIEGQAVFRDIMDRSEHAIAILFIGYIIYHMIRIWIDNKIQEEGGDEALAPGDEGGATGASRLATLLPLFRNFMLAVILLSVIFSALLEMGINVSPLFASAGVVGLAIGFGAQTLVRDIFSGAFYLFDDAFRRGEYVDIGGVKGTVEKISVRSFQLRHHLGALHTIPFGEIQSLTNYSRDWVMMKLQLRLTYDTDPEKVRKLIKKLGQTLLNDPEIGDTFLQPLKSQGVLEMQDSAMVFRVKFMAKPGDQWVIRKRVFQEIRDLFAREGIQFAHKQVTVRLADESPENLTEQQTKAVTAAALAHEDDDDTGAPDSGDDR